MVFCDSQEKNAAGVTIPLTHVTTDYQWSSPPKTDHAVLEGLLVPVHPKMRLRFDRMFDQCVEQLSILTSQEPNLILVNDELEMYFQRARDYKNEFAARELPSQDKLTFLSVSSFPRWVGVARIIRAGVPVFDLLLDTTEGDLGFPVLALVLQTQSSLAFRDSLRTLGLLFPVLP